MVTLDDLAGNIEALNAVGIDGTLCQPLGIGDFLCFRVKHIDKALTDNLSLLLRIRHAFQFFEELGTGIHTNHVKTETFVIMKYIAELILT